MSQQLAVAPYLADGKNNDAAILTYVKANVQDFQNLMREKDIFVVDLSFPVVMSLLEEMGIRLEILSFIKRGEKHMSIENVNVSRLVTKVEFHQNALISITNPAKLSITINVTWFFCM